MCPRAGSDMSTYVKKLSRAQGAPAVARSCSPPTALIKSTMGNDLLTTQLMLVGLNNRDVSFSFKMFDFKPDIMFYVYTGYR